MNLRIVARHHQIRFSGSLVQSRQNILFCVLAMAAIASQASGAQDLPEAPAPPTAVTQVVAAKVASETSHRPPASDEVAYWYGSLYRTPFVLEPNSARAANIERNSIEYKHVSLWALGSNFADVMLNKSNMVEPASGGGGGAIEAYVTLRSTLGLNEVTRTQAFCIKPLRDIAIEGGANIETKNSSFAPAERTIYFGPNLQFAVPRGYFNIGLHLRKEWNHEGVLGKPENYDLDFNVEPTWMLPFTVGKMHFAYTGFAEYNTQKGKDSFGTDSVGEFLLRNVMTVDIGSFMFGRSQLVDLNGGFWYWHNEYGKPSFEPGTKQMTPIIGLSFHLDGGRASHRN